MEDDYPDGVAGQLTVGSGTRGNIETVGDFDAFVVTLQAGFTYQFDVLTFGVAGSTPLSNPYLQVRDFAGNFLDDDDSGVGLNARISNFTASTSGEYFVFARGAANTTGTYEISATQTGQPVMTFDDYPTGTSGFVSVGSFTTGNIETPEDSDTFRVDLQEGFTYRLTVRGFDTNDGTLADPYVDFYDPFGNYLLSDDDGGFGLNAEIIDFVAPTTGTYALDVFGLSGPGTYTVTASQTGQPLIPPFDDYPEGTSGSLSVGSSTFGNIETAGDTDAFTVLLEDGVTYRFDLSENSSQGGLTLDPFLQLTTSTGSVITFDNDSGPSADASIEFTPTFFGVYVLSAEGVGSSTGLYEISATELTTTSFDDYPSGSNGSVTVGSSTTGNIETAGDRDTFNVFLQADFTYQFDLISSIDPGIVSLSDPLLRLTDSSGDIFILNNNGGQGLNSRITDFTPSSSGVYFLDAEGNGSSTGVYQISATQTAAPPVPTVDDFPTGTTGALSVGGNRTGDIETINDIDVFSVFLQAGFTYQFGMRGAPTNNGTLSDPSLQLRDSSGAFLTSDDDSGTGLNASISSFTPTTSGNYLLYAQGQVNGGTGTYQVSATQTGTPGPVNPGPGTPEPETPTDVPVIVQKVARLYEAALDRDGQYLAFDGFNFWIDKAEGGADFRVLSAAFLNSPEFRTKFGDAFDMGAPDYLSNVAFIDALYDSVLGRDGGTGAGRQFWIDKLEIGNGNRSAVLRDFAESPENIANTLPLINDLFEASDGYWVFG
ncbi:MAG: DUF4214 domain-containing protein [Marivita sp.]|uniref:DUF4214 domain-containing protein n=1 Tax=Marivita sp. TaxID=2003365 RepID=UPI003EF3BF7A